MLCLKCGCLFFKYVGKLVWYHHYEKRVWLFQSLKRRTKVSVNQIILGEYVSLTSTVCKVLCLVWNQRLSTLAEEEGMIAEEQAGF